MRVLPSFSTITAGLSSTAYLSSRIFGGGAIGTALIEAATNEARRRGLSLLTVVANPTAEAFYLSCGFAVEGPAETRFGPAMRMSR